MVPLQPLAAAICSARASIRAAWGCSIGVIDPEKPYADSPCPRRRLFICRNCPCGNPICDAAGTCRNPFNEFLLYVGNIRIVHFPERTFIRIMDNCISPPAGPRRGFTMTGNSSFCARRGAGTGIFSKKCWISSLSRNSFMVSLDVPQRGTCDKISSAPDVRTSISKVCFAVIRLMASGRSFRSSNAIRSEVYHKKSWSQKWSTAQTS